MRAQIEFKVSFGLSFVISNSHIAVYQHSHDAHAICKRLNFVKKTRENRLLSRWKRRQMVKAHWLSKLWARRRRMLIMSLYRIFSRLVYTKFPSQGLLQHKWYNFCPRVICIPQWYLAVLYFSLVPQNIMKLSEFTPLVYQTIYEPTNQSINQLSLVHLDWYAVSPLRKSDHYVHTWRYMLIL